MRLFLLFYLLPLSLSGQIKDNFNDSILNSHQNWSGILNAFRISNGMLQSNSANLNSVYYISTEIDLDSTQNWSLFHKLNFNPSSVNYVDFVLCSDSVNLLTMKNGWLLRSGGSADEISLYRVLNGVETKVIDGMDGVLNHSANTFKLNVLLLNDTVFLYHLNDKDSLLNFNYAPAVINPLCKYAGIKIKQSTASFFYKHFFDDLYIGPLIKDTAPPVIDSVWFKPPSTFVFRLNENIDTLKLSQTVLRINGAKCNDIHSYFNKGILQILADHSCFETNRLYSVCLDSVFDLTGNCSDKFCSEVFTLSPVSASQHDILINEIMPDPDPPLGLPNKEYIELYNRTNQYISLSNLLICDPGACKAAGESVLYPDSFVVVYNIPSLNNGGESIRLINKDSLLIHQVEYDLSTYRNITKSNGGYSLELIDPYHLCKGQLNWIASSDPKGGTPGKVNSVRNNWPEDTVAPHCIHYETKAPDIIRMTMNEAFDSILLSHIPVILNHKRIEANINIQNTNAHYLELQIPEPQVAGSTIRFVISGFRDCEGNVLDSQILWIDWMSEPLRNDLIINEVLFNPKSGGTDFIELYNRSNKFIDLNTCFIVDHDSLHIKNIFSISSVYQVLKPKEYLILSKDTHLVCRDYHCGDSHAVKIQMPEMPDMPDDGVSFYLVNLNFETLDSLVCTDDWHYSLISDKNGVSLERINPDNFIMQMENWHSASFVAGYATPGYQNSQFLITPMNTSYFNTQSLSLSPDNNAHEDFTLLTYQLPAPDYLCTIRIFNTKGELVAEPYNNRTVGTEGQLLWDGTNLNGEKCMEGYYLMTILCNSPTNKQIHSYFTFYLTYNSVKK